MPAGIQGFSPGNPGVPFHQSTLARALDRPGKKRKGPEEVGTCVYKVEKGGWGSRRPEDAIFLPEAARRFHAEPVSDKERGKTGVVCVLSHGQEGIITRGLAGRVGARGVAGVLTPRHHMAFQGGLEGRGGVALMDVVIPVRDFSDEFIVPFLHFCISIACMLEMLR